MPRKFYLLAMLILFLSVKAESLIIKNRLLTFEQTIHHLDDLCEDEVLAVELCQFGCMHHNVNRMLVTKESEHYKLALYKTLKSEQGGIYTSEYHDSTVYHNSFTFSKMQLVDFQQALLPNTSSHSTNHNVIMVQLQGAAFRVSDRAVNSMLKTFIEGLEAAQCNCETACYLRSPAYKNYAAYEAYYLSQSADPVLEKPFYAFWFPQEISNPYY